MINFDKANNSEKFDKNFYHGIVVSISQKDKSVLKSFEIIGCKKILFGLLKLYKLNVSEVLIYKVIKDLQDNMSDKILFKKQQFYFHFYRENELIIVFKDKIFNVSPDKSSWKEAIAYGKRMKISEKQLDFIPNRFKDEDF
jgi:hypothetical protein